MSLQQLSQLCHRTATAHAAGVDVRKIWKRESETGSPRKRREMAKVSEAIQRGSTLTDALRQTNYLPPLVGDLTLAGEQTGRIDDVLKRLGDYYEFIRSLRSSFFMGIAWPMLQFVMAILVLGAVIYLSGAIQSGSEKFDMVGFGLMGGRGAMIYFAIVGAISVGAFFLIRSILFGRLSKFLLEPMMRVPYLGQSLRMTALSRLCWTLGMAVESGLDIMRSIDLSFRSTQNKFFIRHLPEVQQKLRRGSTLTEALTLQQDVFPDDFMDGIQVGEESGRLEESLNRLSLHYQERGHAAMRGLAVACGILVWIGVGAFIIFFIFRFAMFYAGIITDLAQ